MVADLLANGLPPGLIREGLFPMQDEGVPCQKIVTAVQEVLELLTPEQAQAVRHPITAHEWRAWSNPEFLLRNFGLRLDDVPEQIAISILSVVEASFSREGYEKALGAMRVNHFLGEICNVPNVMNRYSYNFLLFGEPSTTEPWGWSLYGHHLCLNVFLKGSQMVISPTFTGAEPNVIDEGPWKGTGILHKEGQLGLQMMQNLNVDLQQKAQIYKLLKDPAMLQTGDLKVDRWNQDDQRHLCGAFRDNRIVPYEGIVVADLEPQQQGLLLDIVEEFLLYLPERARDIRKDQIKQHYRETYFCWIGAFGDNDPFYYRIQSPVVILEFDHHSGVFLSNREPAKFHTHTIVRTPNGGDYGNALRDQSQKLH